MIPLEESEARLTSRATAQAREHEAVAIATLVATGFDHESVVEYMATGDVRKLREGYVPRLNGKFVSKAVAEAAAQAQEEEPVSEEVAEKKPRKPRTVDPITSATARVRKARKELDRVKKLHAKRTELPSLEDAQAEYDAATTALQDALNA